MATVWNDETGEYVIVDTPTYLVVRHRWLVTVLDVLQGTTREVEVLATSQADALLAAAPVILPTEHTVGESFVRRAK